VGKPGFSVKKSGGKKSKRFSNYGGKDNRGGKLIKKADPEEFFQKEDDGLQKSLVKKARFHVVPQKLSNKKQEKERKKPSTQDTPRAKRPPWDKKVKKPWGLQEKKKKLRAPKLMHDILPGPKTKTQKKKTKTPKKP